MASRDRIRIGGLPAPPVAEGRQASRFRLSTPANDNKAPARFLFKRFLLPFLTLLAVAVLLLLLPR